MLTTAFYNSTYHQHSILSTCLHCSDVFDAHSASHGAALSWISSYLVCRTQSVRVDEQQSSRLTVACSTVQRRLDYCNSLVYLSSSANLHKLQRIQNSLARTVTCKHRHEHITPVLARLHWLPVHFKLAVITSLSTLSPDNSQVTWPNC